MDTNGIYFSVAGFSSKLSATFRLYALSSGFTMIPEIKILILIF